MTYVGPCTSRATVIQFSGLRFVRFSEATRVCGQAGAGEEACD